MNVRSIRTGAALAGDPSALLDRLRSPQRDRCTRIVCARAYASPDDRPTRSSGLRTAQRAAAETSEIALTPCGSRRRCALMPRVPLAFPDDQEALEPGRHPATIPEIEEALVTAFPSSARRRPLFESWRNVVAAIERVTPIKDHWLDGSFVTKKAEPTDIDCVSFFESATFDALGPVDHTLLKALLSAKVTVGLFGCDSYAVIEYPEDHPARGTYEAARTYWDGWLGHDRNGNAKGYVEVLGR